MTITVHPSIISGTIEAPPSKSASHRAIIMASLAQGVSRVGPIIESDDIQATINACRQLGALITKRSENLIINGTGGRVTPQPNTLINCHASGTTLRLITAIVAHTQSPCRINGNERLRARPLTSLITSLNGIGARISGKRLPITVNPPRTAITGCATVPGDESSQYISGLLVLAPLLDRGLRVKVDGTVVSKYYLDITWSMLRQFGIKGTRRGYRRFHIPGDQTYQAKNYTIESDWSSAGYVIAAVLIAGKKITVKNISLESHHPDKNIITIIRHMGASVRVSRSAVTVQGNQPLRGITTNMNQSPDLVPTVAALAAYAHGTTRLTNIAFLKHKESDRLNDTARVMKNIGIDVKARSNELIIRGGQPVGGTTDCADDHRLAMALTIAGLGSNTPVIIRQAEAINKSWPSFYATMKSLGALIA